MTYTLRLQSDLDDARNELEAIKAEGFTLAEQLAKLVKAFAAKHHCHDDNALNLIDDALDDLIDDATGPVSRRIVRLEDEMGAIEDKDLRRNSPIVL